MRTVYLVFATFGYVAGSAGYISYPVFKGAFNTLEAAAKYADKVGGYVERKIVK